MALLTDIVYMYIAIFLENDNEVHVIPHGISYTLDMGYLKILSHFKNFNVVINGSEGDLGWTPRIILTALFYKMKMGSMFLLYPDPQTCLQY